MQSVTAAVATERNELSQAESGNAAAWVDALKQESLTIFMLSNQLPLLQLGRSAPEVTHQFDDYCTVDGVSSDKRVFARSRIVAFSDPNDILSWSVPPGYEDEYIDSRMCPVLTNVIINIAEVKTIFGLELASAGEAHSDYDNDERVIKMIARGVGQSGSDPLTSERCEWLEVR